jgi:hypothetical protein
LSFSLRIIAKDHAAIARRGQWLQISSAAEPSVADSEARVAEP